MLIDLNKTQINTDGSKAYEERKEETHKRAKERHQRHQAKRRMSKQTNAKE